MLYTVQQNIKFASLPILLFSMCYIVHDFVNPSHRPQINTVKLTRQTLSANLPKQSINTIKTAQIVLTKFLLICIEEYSSRAEQLFCRELFL